MGRPPLFGKRMTDAERMRRSREKTRPKAPPRDDVASLRARCAALEAEVRRRREAEATRPSPAAKPTTKTGAGSSERRIAEVEEERDAALAEAATMRRMLDDGHRVIAQAKAILAAKAIVPADVFKTILHSAHPDRVPVHPGDPSHPDRVAEAKLRARYEKAFKFLNENERALAKRPPPPRPIDLPSTPEEWEAAKWHAKEERRAARAAKKAARKNPPKSLGRR